MKCLAVIPARSESKGLINIKEMCGKPLLAYSVEAALQSSRFSCVHVSTDKEEYAAIARNYGADVPFLRSEEMSSDSANSWDTVKEVLQKYQCLGKEFDVVMLLQPTSPLRTVEDIKLAYNLYTNKNANAVISVCEMEHSPLWSNTLPEDMRMDTFLNKTNNVSRQNFSTYYRINGAIYFVSVPYLQEDLNIYRKNSYAYVMPSERSIDIDTSLDFRIAEFIMNTVNKY